MTRTDWHDVVQRAAGEAYRNEPLAQANDHAVNISVFQGQYPWHTHPGSDETFIVLEGRVVLDVEGAGEIALTPGQLYTVPAGVKHRSRGETSHNVNLTVGKKDRETVFLEDQP